jgi:hypothetical protein
MAKKQTRRSISVSRTTYERLKAFCETNHISMSQLVETRVNDFLGPNDLGAPVGTGAPITATAPVMPRPMPPRPAMSGGLSNGLANGHAPRSLDARPVSHSAAPHSAPAHASQYPGHPSPASHAPQGASAERPASAAAGVPMTSAAARFAVDPPPPIIKPRQDTAAPKPAEKRPEQIFTF